VEGIVKILKIVGKTLGTSVYLTVVLIAVAVFLAFWLGLIGNFIDLFSAIKRLDIWDIIIAMILILITRVGIGLVWGCLKAIFRPGKSSTKTPVAKRNKRTDHIIPRHV
jgi:hypothetical protein